MEKLIRRFNTSPSNVGAAEKKRTNGIAANYSTNINSSDDKVGPAYFGIRLDEICAREKLDVPLIVTQLCAFLRAVGGLHTEGIFRVNGNSRVIENLRTAADTTLSDWEGIGGDGTGSDAFLVHLERYGDIHSVASLLKLFLRELPGGLVPPSYTKEILESYDLHSDDAVLIMERAIHRLPPAHFRLLEYICGFLRQVTQYQNQNKMNSTSLGIVFGPNIFRFPRECEGLTSQNVVNKVMGVLVDRADFLFGGRKASLLEPPSAPQTRKRQVVSSTTTNPSHRRERGGLASASGRTSGFHGTASRLSEQQRSGVSRVMPVTSNTMATCRNGGGGYQTSRDNAHETNIFVQEVESRPFCGGAAGGRSTLLSTGETESQSASVMMNVASDVAEQLSATLQACLRNCVRQHAFPDVYRRSLHLQTSNPMTPFSFYLNEFSEPHHQHQQQQQPNSSALSNQTTGSNTPLDSSIHRFSLNPSTDNPRIKETSSLVPLTANSHSAAIISPDLRQCSPALVITRGGDVGSEDPRRPQDAGLNIPPDKISPRKRTPDGAPEDFSCERQACTPNPLTPTTPSASNYLHHPQLPAKSSLNVASPAAAASVDTSASSTNLLLRSRPPHHPNYDNSSTSMHTPGVGDRVIDAYHEMAHKLMEKRRASNRPDNLLDMTLQEAEAEKLAVQRALLSFETNYGRPRDRQDRIIMRPIYDRYRNVKRLLAAVTAASASSGASCTSLTSNSQLNPFTPIRNFAPVDMLTSGDNNASTKPASNPQVQEHVDDGTDVCEAFVEKRRYHRGQLTTFPEEMLSPCEPWGHQQQPDVYGGGRVATTGRWGVGSNARVAPDEWFGSLGVSRKEPRSFRTSEAVTKNDEDEQWVVDHDRSLYRESERFPVDEDGFNGADVDVDVAEAMERDGSRTPVNNEMMIPSPLAVPVVDNNIHHPSSRHQQYYHQQSLEGPLPHPSLSTSRAAGSCPPPTHQGGALFSRCSPQHEKAQANQLFHMCGKVPRDHGLRISKSMDQAIGGYIGRYAAFSLPELQTELRSVSESKKALQKYLKELEHNFEQKQGRRMGAIDRAPLHAEYNRYKLLKVQLTCLERLLDARSTGV